MPELHPQDWITIVEALSVYDQWLESQQRSERIYALQVAIARQHGFASPGAFVRQAEAPGSDATTGE